MKKKIIEILKDFESETEFDGMAVYERDYSEIAECIVKTCNMQNVNSSKELIDYEIEARRKAKDKNMGEWVKAFVKAVVFVFIVMLVIGRIKSCS